MADSPPPPPKKKRQVFAKFRLATFIRSTAQTVENLSKMEKYACHWVANKIEGTF